MSNLSRRKFLQKALGVAAIAAIPAPVLAAFESGETDTIESGRVVVDFVNQTIRIRPEGKPMTMLEFHREFVEAFGKIT